MNVNDLIFSMQIGEEIEIRVDGHLYFLQPQYETANDGWVGETPPYPFTVIFDCDEYDNSTKIFVGTAEEVANYPFENKYTLKENLDKFERLM